jgi:hypothetical protein
VCAKINPGLWFRTGREIRSFASDKTELVVAQIEDFIPRKRLLAKKFPTPLRVSDIDAGRAWKSHSTR